ncbi:NlpC/P60 family protein [Bilifractor sp. LCP21S3_A7]|uniref:C40 family peptidase n=1 Tax=Bilifractor sp. LCP21S3_A7 TaxID=3438738 RepID=UPI003F912163
MMKRKIPGILAAVLTAGVLIAGSADCALADEQELLTRRQDLLEQIQKINDEREEVIRGLSETDQRRIIGMAAYASGETAISDRQKERDELRNRILDARKEKEKTHDRMLKNTGNVVSMEDYRKATEMYMQLRLQDYSLKNEISVLKMEQSAVSESLDGEEKAAGADVSEEVGENVPNTELKEKAEKYLALTEQENDCITQVQTVQEEINDLDKESGTEAGSDQESKESGTEAGSDQKSSETPDPDTETGLSGMDEISYGSESGEISDDYSRASGDEDQAENILPDGRTSGEDIVRYALQFVGNPYVWGGNSLTKGIDCSGFVQQVFAHFGITLTRTTYTQANEGREVSYAEMQPGDVINYGSHTAIYIGDNRIVHAANSTDGIIVSDNPAFMPIVTIRRFL